MHEITKEFLRAIGKDIRVDDFPSQQNLWMNCDKARAHGVTFSSVENGLIRCARDYGLIV